MAQDLTGRIQQSAANTKEQLAQNAAQRQQVYNYATNQMMDITDPTAYQSWSNANNGLAAAYQLYQDNPNASAEDLYTALGDNYYDAAAYYGDTTRGDAKTRDFFGIRPKGAVLSNIRGLMDNYGKYQAQLKADQDAAARAEIEARNAAPIKYKRGDYERDITKDFSDFMKQKNAELSVSVDANGNLTEQGQAILGDIRQRLIEEGLPIEDNGATLTSIKDLINQGKTATDRLILRDVLSQAVSRQDEQYVPEQDTRSFVERLWEREARQAQLDRDKEAKRLQRERTMKGFAGLAASIGDMIRASEGAPVNPRDWQQMYDNLTAQERANFNNYQVRMAKLKEDAMNQQMAERQMAAAAAEKAAERDLKIQMKGAELQQSGANATAQAAARRYAADKNLEAAKYKADHQPKKAPESMDKNNVRILLGNKAMFIPKSKTTTNALNAIVDILDNPANYGEMKDGKWEMLPADKSAPAISLIRDNAALQTDPQAFFDRNVQRVLSNYWDNLSETARNQIETKLKSMGGTYSDKEDDGWDGYDD